MHAWTSTFGRRRPHHLRVFKVKRKVRIYFAAIKYKPRAATSSRPVADKFIQLWIDVCHHGRLQLLMTYTKVVEYTDAGKSTANDIILFGVAGHQQQFVWPAGLVQTKTTLSYTNRAEDVNTETFSDIIFTNAKRT